MTRRNKPRVSEEFRISLNLALKKFRQNVEQKELEFPSSFTSVERAYIHGYCAKLGLKSKSRGMGTNRYLTVYKKEGSTIVQADATFCLSKTSQHHVFGLLQRFPLSARERQDLLPPAERDRLLLQLHEGRELNNHCSGRLSVGIPQVPPCRADMEALPFQQCLPIWNCREEIIQSVIRHQVVLISGETGSGKTTQVPQFILDHCGVSGIPCRIICTQPRRIAAVSIAERVAVERGEKVGQAVGYQIRLESRISSKTLLTFCTSGVLLRTLMCGDAFAATVTHIIVDELHERDKYSDFLLVILRDLLLKFRSLKLIIMSAVLDTQLFVKYFGGCPVLEVPGKLFDVRPYFLEDILKSTGYTTKAMRKYKLNLEKMELQQQQLESWCLSVGSTLNQNSAEKKKSSTKLSVEDPLFHQENLYDSTEEIDCSLAAKMDKIIHDAWLTGSDECFSSLLNLLLSHNIPVDWQHREASVTPLMVAAGRGNTNAVEQLLTLGANVCLQSSNSWNALDFAKHFGQKQILDLLEAHSAAADPPGALSFESLSENEISGDDRVLLEAYQNGIDEEKVDIDLIVCLIKHICFNLGEGAILVFLPGYDDIVTTRDRILNEEKNFPDHNRLIIYTLHSQMQSSDQRRVFKPVPPGARKIILSTNIAETSITINDIVFVIDSGKVKEKSFDALIGTTQLKTSFISQATAIQRRGRAGRCQSGICFHLFSRMRFINLPKFQIPEILRVPIHELCLQSKLLAPPNVPIADFLARAPDPPPFMVTRNAVTLLKTIDALDPWEELTELGLHLLDLSIEPRLGKMLLYSVILKCLDPVLTIVCALAYRDPFLLPSQPSEKKTAIQMKKKLACNTFSDHLALLRAFQLWQKARAEGYELSFCSKHYLSSATMEMIVGMRMQLVGQLRNSGFVRARSGLGDLKDVNANSDIWPVIRAAICAGAYPNLIRIDRERQQLITQKESKVRFHSSSVLNKFPLSGRESVSSLHKEVLASLPSDWLVYEEMSRTGHISHAHCCSLVSPVTVALFCGAGRLPVDALHDGTNASPADSDSEDESVTDSQKSTFKLDDWVSFKVEPEVARLTLQLRQKWHALFLRRMHMPFKPWSQVDEGVLRTITSVLIAEEEDSMQYTPAGAMRAKLSCEQSLTCVPIHQMPHCSQISDSFTFDGETRDFSRPYFGNFARYRHSSMEKQRGMSVLGSREPSECSSVQSLDSGSMNTSPSISPAPLGNHQMYKSDTHVRYYVIKAHNPKLLDLSLFTRTWSFVPTTERKLLASVKEGKDVILIFSLQGSGHFQGIARFTPHIAEQRATEHHYHSGHFYYIEWLKRANVPFQSTRHLQNAWNENKKVQISRDGQELEPSVGESLCRLWENFPCAVVQSSIDNSSKDHQPLLSSRRQWYNHPRSLNSSFKS